VRQISAAWSQKSPHNFSRRRTSHHIWRGFTRDRCRAGRIPARNRSARRTIEMAAMISTSSFAGARVAPAKPVAAVRRRADRSTGHIDRFAR